MTRGKGFTEPEPHCPKCQRLMQRAQLTLGRRTSGTADAMPARVLPVWHCAACHIDAPRLDDAA